MLWLGLLARDTGTLASEHLKIRDEVTALEFNLAVSHRLFRFDNEKDTHNKKFWMGMLGANAEESEYTDPETAIW
jgi:hypothetical protein